MPKKHEKFHSTNGKRQILIADDESINREMLGFMLQDEYEILYACDGRETMEMILTHKKTLSLILLDIMMPILSGIEILKTVREDKELSHIPVIVMTSETESEIESLNLGAIDFVSKPYPPIGVIKARVLHAIELSEDRDIISLTERDELTGLYNREFFYRYAEQYDQYHQDTDMDAIVVDINHFRMINERYGKNYGDEVLKKIGQQLVSAVADQGGIVCRRNADTFLVYCPHRNDYQEILEKASISLTDDEAAENRIRLRMGVYCNADKTIHIERRFDRAKMASDTVRGSFTKRIGIYDESLHEKELYAEQLIEDFSNAIDDNQFKVFYQPKFDVRPDTPVLTSAEALVRWDHPELGMISPGIFIPLFEQNGLIQKLDHYVWKETARQIKEWKEHLTYSIPVSVNVSRVDMFDPHLTDILQGILDEYGLTGEDLYLEITESAYTQEYDQIIETVNKLRDLGFKIEMDDFGTGYSSLNMISTLPIDALKLDMQFIRNAFKPGGNIHLMEVIIDIAKYLAVPVVAEGVETASQLHALKDLGCDIVQGYFFSKPVPAAEFEPFILQKKEADLVAKEKSLTESEETAPETETETVEAAVAAGEAEAAQEETGETHPEEGHAAEADAEEAEDAEPEEGIDLPDSSKAHTGIQMKTASIFIIIIAVIAAAALMIADFSVAQGYKRMEAASDRYIAAQSAASDMESGSDYLTDRVRCFVVTGDVEYLKDFHEEVSSNKRRDRAVEDLESLVAGVDQDALDSLNKALTLSNELVEIENYAMRLKVEAEGYNMSQVPEEIRSIAIRPEDRNLTKDQMEKKAENLVFDNNYMHYKDRIRENVNLCTQALIRSSSMELEESSAKLSLLVNLQTALSILFLLIVFGFVAIITQMIRKPLTKMVKKMQNQEPIEPTGMEELRFVTRIYNKILQENAQAREKLSHEASHDALTGLFNRGAYDLLIGSTDTEHMALILIDVDHFKDINDTYGHAVGDRVLKRVADILRHSFRSVDNICRIGGDEFAVIMTRANSSMEQIVVNKINRANDLLQHPKDDLPPVSLSVGVAFSDRDNPQGDIFKDADSALYEVKRAGRRGCAIY